MKNIFKKLKSDDPVTREQILEFLISDNQIIPFKNIKPLIDDENTFVREKVLELLPLYGNDIAVKHCMKALTDPDELVRITASEVLLHTQLDYDSITLLIDLFTATDEPLITRNIAEVLGMTKDPRSIDPLKDKLKKHPDDQMKLGIYIGLVHMGFKAYFKNILSLLHSEDYQVRCAVANSMDSTIGETSEILKKLNKRLEIEPTIAVKSSLSAALSRLSAM